MEFVALAALSIAGTWLALPLGRSAGIALLGRLGQGYLAGALLAGYVASLFERFGITAYAWPLFVAVALAAAGAVVREIRRGPIPPTRRRPIGLAMPLFLVVALAHFALAWLETGDRALFPWDAWTNWLFRARAWFLEPGVAFAPVTDGTPTGPLQVPGAHYPAAIPGLATWLARLGGEWSWPRLLAAWPCAYLAAMLAFAAFADHALYSRRIAGVAAAVLASTPLLATHAQLAGYVDLWVFGALLLALAAAYEWRRTGRWDPRILVLLALPLATKVEGLVWLALLGLAIALVARPRLVGPVLLVAVLVVGGSAFAWPGGIELMDGRLVLNAQLVRIPHLGETPLGVNPLLQPLARATLLGGTFGVTIWAMVAAILCALPLRGAALARHGSDREAWRVVALFGLVAAAFVLALFAFTIAGRWALDQTAIGRVMMQLLPAWVLVAARVFEPLDPAARARR
jgi:hypothetical protein